MQLERGENHTLIKQQSDLQLSGLCLRKKLKKENTDKIYSEILKTAHPRHFSKLEFWAIVVLAQRYF